ncbi:fumarylacetoacetate hydrolase family protein [Hoeflea poritis]|uniref:Fumarylacetoacetate hydrolase family protein n=1 Tax=Hoeflea poritis TaxID=2993659 RepID=A0ABT4VUW7_9HYPH|nr:fumarylacetoacetate hydrolase family protein [Hoeflea poritis]MDA4848522.1 fumarylacetoacetate hydrolase family protein [Hoeflea poritis]
MRVVRFNGGRVGVIESNDVVDLTELEHLNPKRWPDTAMIQFIERSNSRIGSLELPDSAPRVPLQDVTLDCPINWPNKVIAFPANYQAHIEEQKSSKVGLISKYTSGGQGFFLKANSSLSGPNEPIRLPPVEGREVHHECELAIIIGKGGRGIAKEAAYEHIFGYSCLIDVVIRGKEERVMRKSYDTFCPLGPWIVTRDEITNPQEMGIRLTVNGKERQKANTRDLIVDIPTMIEMSSAVMTLYPGDVIATGTPSGVGPIKEGDLVASFAEGVGALEVRVESSAVGDHPVWDKPQE